MVARPLLLAAALAALAAAPAHGAGLSSVVYERVLMREAGARCKLFEPRLLASLDAGTRQARAAALRAGEPQAAVEAADAHARTRAAETPCASPDLRIAAQRVRAAFTPWSRQETLVLPGPGGGWRARRRPARPGAFWALSTSGVLAGHGFTLGLRSPADRAPAAFAVEIADPAAGTAFLARLVVRDPGRAPQPYLAPGGEPPAGAERVVAASDRRALDGGRAWRFTFPAGAADALAALDPRENARLELVYPGASGDRIVSALVPVGDFAVGRAFLDAGR